MFSVGTKIIGNWGAMHPVSEGEIVSVETEERRVLVHWDDMAPTVEDMDRIDVQPEVGSPIGIFLK